VFCSAKNIKTPKRRGILMAEEQETEEEQGLADIEVLSDIEALKTKIKYLEEELVRKAQAIEKLKKENLLLFKTALKNSESKLEDQDSTLKPKKKN
jgi:hypothetical protein